MNYSFDKNAFLEFCKNEKINLNAARYFYDFYCGKISVLSLYVTQQKISLSSSHIHYYSKKENEYSLGIMEQDVKKIFDWYKPVCQNIVRENSSDKEKMEQLLALTLFNTPLSEYQWGLNYEEKAKLVENEIYDHMHECFGKKAGKVFNYLIINDPNFSLVDKTLRRRDCLKYLKNTNKVKTSELDFMIDYYRVCVLNYAKKCIIQNNTNGNVFTFERKVDLLTGHSEDDFSSATNKASTMPLPYFKDVMKKHFNNYVGLDDIKYAILNYGAMRNFETPEKPYSILITGNPGTGKSTAAKLIAAVLYETGYLTSPKFCSISAASLQGKFVGHTIPKIEELFKENKGGLIFLDEIYSLASNTEFNKDAVSQILLELEKPENAETIVVGAGYDDKIEEFFNANPGLKSRFSTKINLKDYTLPQLLEITEKNFKYRNFEIDTDALTMLEGYYNSEMHKPNFGNARCVRESVANVLKHTYLRLWEERRADRIVNQDDVQKFIDGEAKSLQAPQKMRIGFGSTYKLD